MQINHPELFSQIVQDAIAKTAINQRWLNAVVKAAAGLRGSWVVTELADGLAVTTESGQTYFCNGVCQCKAFELGQPCKHRAAAKLMKNYNAAVALAASAPKDERAELIETIKNTWQAKHPRQPIADALTARFHCTNLEMLNVDFLRRIHNALSA